MSLALYIHIPFCQKKCHFCSFPIAVSQMSYRAEYIKQLEREAGLYSGASLASVYVGGGTPSCLDAVDMDNLWNMIRRGFFVRSDAEITCEVNPESVDAKKLRHMKDAGVTRVSLGVQSWRDDRLVFLGRPHTREDAIKAFHLLREAGFKNVNVDFMFGFPDQTADDLADDLGSVLRLGSEHVSIYALTVEERSLFYVRKVGIDNDRQADHYEQVRLTLGNAGLRQYEVSNFARPGYESLHNYNYWRGGEYIGLGMAAHSHIGGRRFWNADSLPLYLRMMSDRGRAQVGEELLRGEAKLIEFLLFGLRMNEGVSLADLQQRVGVNISEEKRVLLDEFKASGFLEEVGGRLRATDRGRLVLDEISSRIV